MSDTGNEPEFSLGSEEGQAVETPEVQPEATPAPVFSPFAQNYLANVPEEERPIAQKHILEWDKGFNRYAQGVQQQIRQYQELGDPQTLQTARSVYQRLIDDPQGVAEWLHQQGYTVKEANAAVQQAVNGQAQEEDPLLKHPKFQELNQKIDRYDRILGMLAEQNKTRAEQEEAEKADKELSDYMSAFPDKKVPEKFILTYLNAGIIDPQRIAQEWNETIQGYTNDRHANQVPNIVGATSSPTPKQDPATMNTDQRQAALLAALPKDW